MAERTDIRSAVRSVSGASLRSACSSKMIITKRGKVKLKEEEKEKVEEENGDLLIAGRRNMSAPVYPTIAVLKHPRLKCQHLIMIIINAFYHQ